MERIDSTLLDWWEQPFVERIAILLVAVLAVLLVVSLIKKQLNRNIKDVDNKYRARKAVNMVGYLLIVAACLFVYSDKLGNIGVALGVAGAGIAFALQEVIVSIAGWLNILIAGTVGVGQRVKIGDVKGDIIDIGVMSTTIMEVGDWVNGDLYNGRIISLANSFVFKEKIHNYSAEYPFLWDEITVPIRTESDYNLARKVFTDVLNELCADYASKSEAQWNNLANKYRVENAQVQPMVTLQFDENWITFTLRYIVDYKKRRSTKDAIYTKLLNEIAKYEQIIMIATSTLEVTNVKND
ncbi:MAG: mechanosensitive ion channel [Cyclobacteriaceae bacterium]